MKTELLWDLLKVMPDMAGAVTAAKDLVSRHEKSGARLSENDICTIMATFLIANQQKQTETLNEMTSMVKRLKEGIEVLLIRTAR